MDGSQCDIGNPLSESAFHNVAELKTSPASGSKEKLSLRICPYDDTRANAEMDMG